MENSNIIKQAKSDIFKELHTIIGFYINKGAKPAALKKFYKNNKRFNDLLEDIRNKGINLVKDEMEYKKLVRDTLNDILDDFIAKNKDLDYKNKQDSKLKHIKEFNSYSINEDLQTWICGIGAVYCLYKFLIGLWKSRFDNMTIDELKKVRLNYLNKMLLKRIKNDVKLKFTENIVYYIFIIDDITIKINKNENYIFWNLVGEEIEDTEYSRVSLPKEDISTLIKNLKEYAE